MTLVIRKNSFRWKIKNFTRENIRKRCKYSYYYEDDFARFKTPKFTHNVNGLKIEWFCNFLAPEEEDCNLEMFLTRDENYYSDVRDYKCTIDISIIQSDGVVKKIKSEDDIEYLDYEHYYHDHYLCWMRWSDLLKIDDIFNPQNKYLDSDSTLTFIIDVTTSHKDYDGSLKSLCGLQLLDMITTENVIDLLYYADRCNLEYLEKKCLDFIYEKYDKIGKNEEKWKDISTKLMLKVIEKCRYPGAKYW